MSVSASASASTATVEDDLDEDSVAHPLSKLEVNNLLLFKIS